MIKNTIIEDIIAYHCGPALAGIKPANIVACYKKNISDVHQSIDRLNKELNFKDIYLESLCECEKRILLIVYRKEVLSRQLKKPEIRKFLYSYGYNINNSIDDDLEVLKKKICTKDFPHEIGVFLGYPLHDIYGFLYQNTSECILTGEWKVYRDKAGAEKLFERYNRCRNALRKRIREGKTLAQIFCAA